MGSRAELPDKSSLSEKKYIAAFAFAVVCDGKGSLAVKSSAVDLANGRISHSLGWLDEVLMASPHLSVRSFTFPCDPSCRVPQTSR